MRQFKLKFDTIEYDLYSGYASVIVDIDEPGFENLFVNVMVDFDINDFDYEWEPDGPATYVPYGERMVKYDDGKGGLDKVDARGFLNINEITFEDKDNYTIPENEVKVKYNFSDEDIKDLKEQSGKLAVAAAEKGVAEEIENDPDYWPEPAEYDPDWDN